MKGLKVILLGAAALYAFKDKIFGGGSADSTIDELKQKIDELEVDLVDKERELEDEKNKAAGELAGQLNCYMTVRLSHIAYNEWNSGFDLLVKNTGQVTRYISAVRVFWTVGGYTSTWSPWTTDAYTLKPGASVKIILKGTCVRRLFNSIAQIDAVRKMFGTAKSGNEYTKQVPISCEADFILSSNGELFHQQLKDFDGKAYAYTDERIIYPYTQTNGKDQKDINAVINKGKETGDEE